MSTWSGKAIHMGCTTHYEVFNRAVYCKPLCHRDHMVRTITDYGEQFIGWGYEGNGPRQLAVSMLWYSCVNHWVEIGKLPETPIINLVKKYSSAFTKDVVSKFGDEWSMTSDEVVKWIKEQELKDQNEQAKPAKQTNAST